jgi:hypothetical protein
VLFQKSFSKKKKEKMNSRLSSLLLLISCCSIFIIVAVDAQSGSGAIPPAICPTPIINNNEIQINTWPSLIGGILPIGVINTNFSINLCNAALPYNSGKVFVTSYPIDPAPTGSSSSSGGPDSYYPFDTPMGFDIFASSTIDDSDPDGNLVLSNVYGSSQFSSTGYIVLTVKCDINAAALEISDDPAPGIINNFGTKSLVITLVHQQLCAAWAPPTLAPPPPPITTTTTSVPSTPCDIVHVPVNNGPSTLSVTFPVDPNSWSSFFSGTLTPVPTTTSTGSPTSAMWGNLCQVLPNQTTLPDSGNPFPGYVTITGDDFPSVNFDTRRFQSVNSTTLTYLFTSREFTGDYLTVNVMCAPSFANLDYIDQKLYWSSAPHGNYAFTINLGISNMCVANKTDPGTQCQPFGKDGVTINPFIFPPGVVLLKNANTSVVETVMIDACNSSFFNQSTPGYVMFRSNPAANLPSRSYDIIENQYYHIGRQVYIILYRSSNHAYAGSKVQLSISCGGVSTSLSVPSKQMTPVANGDGGTTYQIDAVLQQMCI